MDRNEIRDRIFSCKNDDDIKKLVDERIRELEANSIEETIGQNYTDIYRGFISSKVHYKPADKIFDYECPDLLYDDMTDYENLIKDIRKDASYYNFITLFSTMFFSIHQSLPSNRDKFNRLDVYMLGVNSGRVSIKNIKAASCAFCSENAGMAHNMFKFLGLDSELVVGQRNEENHAYTIVFPKGYDNMPAIIYDPSHHIDYTNDAGEKRSFGYFIPLSSDEYNNMLLGEKVRLNLDESSKKLESLYNISERLPGYRLNEETVEYGIGLKTKKDTNIEGKTK